MFQSFSYPSPDSTSTICISPHTHILHEYFHPYKNSINTPLSLHFQKYQKIAFRVSRILQGHYTRCTPRSLPFLPRLLFLLQLFLHPTSFEGPNLTNSVNWPLQTFIQFKAEGELERVAQLLKRGYESANWVLKKVRKMRYFRLEFFLCVPGYSSMISQHGAKNHYWRALFIQYNVKIPQ